MMDGQVEQPWLPFSEALLDWDDDFHDLMLGDRLRMKAYRDAIRETVKPGDVVLDLGTGTGILALWALEAGASRVYGIDLSEPVLERAVQRMTEAGYADRFIPVNRLSFEVTLPEQVDVLVSEIMGNMADNEDFQPILRDAIRRFLKPGGHTLPMSTATYLVPVAAGAAHQRVAEGQVATLSAHYTMAGLFRDKGIGSPFNIYYDTILPQTSELASPRCIYRYKEAWDQPPWYAVDARFSVQRSGRFTGFKCYFVARLSPGVSLDISGDDLAAGTASASWKHAYLPIETPFQVEPGDTLAVCFSRGYPQSGGQFRQVYRWHGKGLRDGVELATFDQCMDESQLVVGQKKQVVA